jgi:hypothetical protein
LRRDGEREAFAESVQRAEGEARQPQGYPAAAALDQTAQATVGRVALREALLAHQLLRLL